jgi:hypothetical protein
MDGNSQSTINDESWARVARDTREALRWLGYPIDPKCLPDETEPCGGSFAMHAMAQFAMIKAICDHQLDHLHMPAEVVNDVYSHALADLSDHPGCQL